MRRRNVLKGIAASALQIAFGPGWPLQSAVARRVTRRVRPTDPQWPGADSWAKLRAAVGGNLLRPKPLFAACGTTRVVRPARRCSEDSQSFLHRGSAVRN